MLSVKNPQVDALLSQLVKDSGESKTQLVLKGLKLLKENRTKQVSKASVAEDLLAAGQRIAALSQLDDRSFEDIIGYDEHGLPS